MARVVTVQVHAPVKVTLSTGATVCGTGLSFLGVRIGAVTRRAANFATVKAKTAAPVLRNLAIKARIRGENFSASD